MLAHGLAQFHHLMSKSQDEQDGRITLVRHKHGEDSQQLLDKPADISCADILAALEAHPEGGMHSRRLSRFVRGHATGEDTDSVAPSDYCPGPSLLLSTLFGKPMLAAGDEGDVAGVAGCVVP